jgi:hypothetical protein
LRRYAVVASFGAARSIALAERVENQRFGQPRRRQRRVLAVGCGELLERVRQSAALEQESAKSRAYLSRVPRCCRRDVCTQPGLERRQPRVPHRQGSPEVTDRTVDLGSCAAAFARPRRRQRQQRVAHLGALVGRAVTGHNRESDGQAERQTTEATRRGRVHIVRRRGDSARITRRS